MNLSILLNINRFLRLKDENDNFITKCILKYDDDEDLLGYELILNITEHKNNSNHWKGVDYCTVNPILSLIKENKIYFNEIIIMSNYLYFFLNL